MADDKKPKEQQGLPEGWKWVRLGEVAKITTGNSNVQDASDDGVYPFFDRSGEIKRSERYFLDTEAVIVPGEGSDFFPKYFKGKFDLHQRTYAIFNFKGLDGRFLYYLMHLLRVNLIRIAVGTTVLSLRLPHFQNLEFPLPPIPEQRKIAQILETVDNAIEKTEKIIEKYKRIKQGLMQDLLTKGIDENGNIRSEKTHKFKDSPLGRIPEEWEVVRLEDLCFLRYGKNLPKEKFKENADYKVYGANGIIGFYDKYTHEKPTVLVSCRGEYSGVINIAEPYSYITNNSIALTIKDEKTLNTKFLYYFLKILPREKIVSGSAQPQVVITDLKNIIVLKPPLPEQQKIAEILSQIDQAIEREEKYKEKLERLKKGLMEDLLTGKVRVNKLLEGENHGMA